MRKRRAFTLLELLVTGCLSAFLAVLLARLWRDVARPVAGMVADGRVNQEAALAAAALQRDMGGCVDPLGLAARGRLVGRAQPAGGELWLCFDGGDSPNGEADWASPDRVVVYRVESGRLVRRDQFDETSVTVARHVTGMTAEDLGGAVRITVAFTYRGTSRTQTLVARDP